jgi:hypothetical protein
MTFNERIRTAIEFCMRAASLPVAIVLTAGCTNAVNYEVAGLTDPQCIAVRRSLTADQLNSLDDWIIRKGNVHPIEKSAGGATSFSTDHDRCLAIAEKPLPRRITVEQALDDQHEWVENQRTEDNRRAEKAAAEQALREGAQASLEKILSVTLVSKRNEVHSDEKNYVVLALSYENKGDKEVRGVEGILKFSDIYKHPVADIHWVYKGSIPANQTVFERDIDLPVDKSSETMERLWETDYDKLILAFEISSITFSDAVGAPTSSKRN